MGNVNIRIDDALKQDAERIFAELGLSMSTATNVFYRQVVRCGGIPFDLRIDPFYSTENQAYLQKIIHDYETGESKPIVKTLQDLEKLADE
jgi:DNA-damage-inducible protein J